MSPSEALNYLGDKMRQLAGDIPIPPHGSITFVTSRLPYGFAFSAAPSTHLLTYPDLGTCIINGFAAEQKTTRGVGVAVLVDPETTDAPEMEAAEKLLAPRRIFLRCYNGKGATVRAVSDMIELFPYDLLIIATHCGDAPGYRWTYEFEDSDKRQRTLVVDIALGVGTTDDPNMLDVVQFQRFISLDGVDWNDPEKSKKLDVGNAIIDFISRTRSGKATDLQPTKKGTVTRVAGSAALKMYDNNYISLPSTVADVGNPIVINNACCSWHRLSQNYTFSGARSYIGTLFQVSTSEAHDVVVKLLDKHFGKSLAHALWSAQREVYGNGVRRPYIVTGVYPQQLRTSGENVPRYVVGRLSKALTQWKAEQEKADKHAWDAKRVQKIQERIKYYDRELTAFRRRWADVL